MPINSFPPVKPSLTKVKDSSMCWHTQIVFLTCADSFFFSISFPFSPLICELKRYLKRGKVLRRLLNGLGRNIQKATNNCRGNRGIVRVRESEGERERARE